jgi:hypothetical protein
MSNCIYAVPSPTDISKPSDFEEFAARVKTTILL